MTNHRDKDVSLILPGFVDIVSENGCLLLNVGPNADGAIPETEAEMMREIGARLELNGETMYGSRPWNICGEGPTETVEGHLSGGRNKGIGPEEVRFTTKSGALYSTALGPAERKWTIETLRAGSEHLARQTVPAVRLLDYEGGLGRAPESDA